MRKGLLLLLAVARIASPMQRRVASSQALRSTTTRNGCWVNMTTKGSRNTSTHLRPQQTSERNLTSICACAASCVRFTDCTACGKITTVTTVTEQQRRVNMFRRSQFQAHRLLCTNTNSCASTCKCDTVARLFRNSKLRHSSHARTCTHTHTHASCTHTHTHIHIHTHTHDQW